MARVQKGLPSQARSVVTGAGSGFGRAVSLELARRGARLLVSDVRLEGAEATANEARALGAEAHAMQVDVRDPEQVGAMEARARDLFGGTDVLVNNAGLAVVGALGEIPTEQWRYQVDVNLLGVVWGCHHFAPRMAEQGGGFVLNVASAAGIASAPLMGPYNVTKAGVIALSETLYTELADKRVHVSALCPTFFRTNIHKDTRAFGGGAGKKAEELVTKSRWSADDIAKIALDGLASRQLYILPQADARAVWRLKRALGQGFYDALRGPLGKRLLPKD